MDGVSTDELLATARRWLEANHPHMAGLRGLRMAFYVDKPKDGVIVTIPTQTRQNGQPGPAMAGPVVTVPVASVAGGGSPDFGRTRERPRDDESRAKILKFLAEHGRRLKGKALWTRMHNAGSYQKQFGTMKPLLAAMVEDGDLSVAEDFFGDGYGLRHWVGMTLEEASAESRKNRPATQANPGQPPPQGPKAGNQ